MFPYTPRNNRDAITVTRRRRHEGEGIGRIARIKEVDRDMMTRYDIYRERL